MAREPETALPINAAELQAFNALLRNLIASNEVAIPLLQTKQMEATFSKKSQENAVKMLNSFKREIEYSTYRSNAGNKIRVGERKPRSNPKEDDEISPKAAKAAIDRKTTKKK